MSSQQQLEANRLNARKSTGPRSVEGKRISSMNALQFGVAARSFILPGEDPEELQRLIDGYREQHQPIGPMEVRLVDEMAMADWMRKRYHRIEARVVAAASDPSLDPDTAAAMLFMDKSHARVLQHLFRRQQAAERSWNGALKELRRIQAERQSEEPETESLPTEPPAAQNGFVLQLVRRPPQPSPPVEEIRT